MNSMTFLINTLFNLYIMIVLMRLWLQWARADFYNPFSQFIVNATQPVVAPLRRVIPSVGSIDLATLLFAYLLSVVKFIAMEFVATGTVAFTSGYFIIGLISLVKEAGSLLFWVLIIRAILSWVSQGQNPVEYVMIQLTEPVIAPIRRVLPSFGGIDFSILVVFIILQFLNYFIGDLLSPFFGNLWFSL